MTLVVDAESPQALIGKVSRVAILHPVVSCRGNDEEHEGSGATQRASSCQCVEHGGWAQDRVLTHTEEKRTQSSCRSRVKQHIVKYIVISSKVILQYSYFIWSHWLMPVFQFIQLQSRQHRTRVRTFLHITHYFSQIFCTTHIFHYILLLIVTLFCLWSIFIYYKMVI